MKILMIDDSYRLYRNSLIKALSYRGLEVNAIIPCNNEDAQITKNIKWLNPISKGNSWLKLKPIKIIHHSHMVAQNILLRDRLIKSACPSLIHMQGISYPLFEMLFGQQIEVPTIVTVHNVIAHDLFLYNLPRILKRIYEKKRFSAFIVHSEQCKQMFCDYFSSLADRVFIIPCGCNEPKSMEKKKARSEINLPIEGYPLILFFGKIRKYKGLQYLIKSLAQITSYFPETQLVVAGKAFHDKFESYLKIIRTENMQRRIIQRIGYIPEEEADMYFQAADLVVLPYTRFTSQSAVLMKAYSNQCPVVVTDTGAIGETVSKDCTGVVVPPSSTKHLADGILRILSDREMQKKAKANMLHLVQMEYNWNKIAAKTITLYKRILQKS